MADPRSSFRFRMPRLRPSVPPPRSTTRTTTRTPSPLQPAAPSPPIPPPSSTAAAPAPVQPVLPPPPASTAAAPAPPQDEPRSMPPPSPVVSSSTKPATAKSPEPTKTDSQPSSPSQTGIRSRVSSQPPSPSPISTEPPRVSSKPPSPSTRSQLTSQPPKSPSPPLASEKKITSLPPSPIVTTPKLQPKEPVPDIASDQKDVDLALNATPDAINEVEQGEIQTTTETNEETTSMEQPRIEAPKVEEKKQQDAINTTSNIPNKPETKSMISQPIDTESPQNPKPINRTEASADVNKRDTSPRKQFLKEKPPLSVITLAGDNRGTSMRINGATKRERAIHIHRRYKVDADEIADTTTDGEESSNGKKSEKKDSEPTDNLEKNAYINCNIQGINNSMVFNSSFAERNPGVHLENVNKPKRKKSKPTVTDTNPPSSQKITTIRRRCLRGLFMESSDSSDPDDPHKPRRHGCRYTGGEKKMDVV